MKKLLLSTLIIGSAISMNVFAASSCPLNLDCDMANAPLVVTLEKGKEYTCTLNLHNRELTTQYQINDGNLLVEENYITLSHYTHPAKTMQDISINTSTFNSATGEIIFSFISGYDLGYETVYCSEKKA